MSQSETTTTTATNLHESSSSSKRARPQSSSTSHDRHAGSTSNNTGLGTFLHHDIQPEGHHLLLPFLTTDDLLCLSECSKGLVRYRYHLSRVKIVPHPWPTPSIRRCLLRLLLDQQGKGIQHLHIDDITVLHVLDLASWGCFEGLKTLDLSGMDMDYDAGISSLVRALAGGGLENLEELNLSNTRAGGGNLGEIMAALGDAACPGLQRLYLRQTGLDDGSIIAGAMSTGNVQALQVLDLSYNPLHSRDLRALCTALEGEDSPHLRRLILTSCALDLAALTALGSGLASGLCPHLEELEISRNFGRYQPSRFVPIFGAMEAGGCPNLKKLNLQYNQLDSTDARALSRALASGNCHRIESLELTRASRDPDFITGILRDIYRGSVTFPQLRRLCLSNDTMNNLAGERLGQFLSRGACPALQTLEIARNYRVKSDIIMKALGAGACPALTELDLRSLGMSTRGAVEVAVALASGWLKNLTVFKIGHSSSIGDRAMNQILEALIKPGASPKLRHLSVDKTCMGLGSGDTILHSLNRGMWPHLEELALTDDTLNEDFIPRLCRVLSKGGVGSRRIKQLVLYCPGKDAVIELCNVFHGGACPLLDELHVEVETMDAIEPWLLQELEDSLKGRAKVIVGETRPDFEWPLIRS